MPQFFFDLIVDGQVVPDPDGLPLAELRDARFEAALALAEMMVVAIREENSRTMDVTIRNEGRKPLARIFISIREDLN